MVLNFIPQSKKARALISAFAGFVAYGGWAYFANMDYGTEAGLKAACTQGSFSFILTLTMNLMMEWLFQLSEKPKIQFSLTILFTCLFIYSASWGVNYLAGTPEIFMTVLPGWIFSTLYTMAYSFTLFKLAEQPNPADKR